MNIYIDRASPEYTRSRELAILLCDEFGNHEFSSEAEYDAYSWDADAKRMIDKAHQCIAIVRIDRRADWMARRLTYAAEYRRRAADALRRKRLALDALR